MLSSFFLPAENNKKLCILVQCIFHLTPVKIEFSISLCSMFDLISQIFEVVNDLLWPTFPEKYLCFSLLLSLLINKLL